MIAEIEECETLIEEWKNSDGSDIRLQRLYKI